jgi:alkanesulfonate monooxygenase SsuD/methylene tetrahydromethanopterin reductase-like flavin-dependent oxidoreductase (luciferase family)
MDAVILDHAASKSTRQTVKFGVFDQNDRSGLPIAQQYEERLALAELLDERGFYAYHMSEHHATPLSTTPSPSVFISALTQRTNALRLVPLVYLLPLYHPARLYEEICMLDHLSGGRFEFGVGRGASPHELAALGIDPAQAAKMYNESVDILEQCFDSESVNFKGDFWSLEDYVAEMKPFQLPRPPMWYALSNPDSAVWPAQRGMDVVCGGPVSKVRALAERYREEWHKAQPTSIREPLIGINRYVVVAETDAAALKIGRAAWPRFYDSFMKLWRKHGTKPVNAALPEDFDQLLLTGNAIVGSPKTVVDRLTTQLDDGALNYFIASFVFGDIPKSQVFESVRLFASEVMPAFSTASSMPH